MLDPRRLQVLKAVVDAGSVTGAAAELRFTASAVSQSLAALEREAKTQLFEKAGRGIRPTQAGLLLAEHARIVLEQLAAAEKALEAVRAGEAGRLRMAAFATAGTNLVPRALARFRRVHPGVELELAIAETDEAIAALESAQIDLAVVGEHARVEIHTPALTYTHLLEDRYRIVVSQSHPAAGKRSVRLEDLSEEAWISTASARCNCLQTVTMACSRAGYSPRFALEADEFATTVGFVAAGLGVAMVPMLALSSVPKTVRICRIQGEEPKRQVYAVTRATTSGDARVEALSECLRFSAGSYLRAAA